MTRIVRWDSHTMSVDVVRAIPPNIEHTAVCSERRPRSFAPRTAQIGNASNRVGKVIMTAWPMVYAVLARTRSAALQAGNLIHKTIALGEHNPAAVNIGASPE
jgi:hypothetical protein